ncbi:MAG: phosphotransferase [bacterium]|nr:phosphotransferase [bacterium]
MKIEKLIKLIKDFACNHLDDYSGLEKLDGDASTRIYFRAFSGDTSYIVCRDAQFADHSPEEYPFCILHSILKGRGIAVPEIYALDKGQGLLLLQDLGDNLVEDRLPFFSGAEIKEVYSAVIRTLVNIQKIKGKEHVPFGLSFDTEKLMFEFDFFIEHTLDNYFASKTSLSGKERELLRKEFFKICAILDEPGLFVLNHRDFHSRNILLFNAVPYIIDFQDARMGLPQYDLVSLLRDSYVRLNPDVFLYLKDYYYSFSKEAGVHAMDRETFEYYFDIMAFQRNIKALGTFGYMTAVKKKPRYEQYITPTAACLHEYVGRREELSVAWDIIKRFF